MSPLKDALTLGNESLRSGLLIIRQVDMINPLRIMPWPAITEDEGLLKVADHYLASKLSDQPPTELLFAFIAHSLLLDTIFVGERAQNIINVNRELLDIILDKFLPRVFFAAETILSSHDVTLHVDGRLYLALVNFLMEHPTSSMEELIGSGISDRVRTLWKNIRLPSVDFSALVSRFPPPPASPEHGTVAPQPLRLLSFENEVFNKELAVIRIATESDGDEALDPGPKFNFGQGVLFSDTNHWHSSKAILPRHLGGQDPKPTDVRQRRRLLKRDQRFMTNLQRQAGTLTGALGASLKQIVIPPVGTHQRKGAVGRIAQVPSSQAAHVSECILRINVC